MQKTFRALLCISKRASGGARHHGAGKFVLVPIVRKGTAGLLLDVRIVFVLGSARRDCTSIAMGAFDTPTSTHLEKHIFVAEKGDYYEIEDDLPQNQH